jgi:cell wall-associated NlpC family hydrolase
MFHATLRVRLTVIAASLLTCLGFVAASPASASPSPTNTPTSAGGWQFAAGRTAAQTTAQTAAQKHKAEVREVLAEARRQKGKPYSYGADGPHSFDCSGLVRFVYLHSVHRSLPHNAAQQYHALRHIQRKHLQLGDLVFVDNGGYVSHVGIYDGHHTWWVAPHTGTRVQRQHIYKAHLVYARVLVYRKVLPGGKHKHKH